MSDLLSDDEVAERLPAGWDRDSDEIVRTFSFDEYLRGVNFAQMIGEIAEAQFHHPTVEIRYKEVEVRFTSHEAGGITDEDIEMARLVNNEADDTGTTDSTP